MRNTSPLLISRTILTIVAFACVPLYTTASGCGGDDGIARVERAALSVTVGESGVTGFVSFPIVPPGQNRDAEQGAIVIGNAGSDGSVLTVTSITTIFDSTGYINVRGGSLPEVPFDLSGENKRRITLRLTIPAPAESDEPIACPDPPADLPSTVDSSLYCGQVDIVSNAPEENTATIYILVPQSEGEINVEPDVLTFEAPVIGQAIKRSFTITNDSTSGELNVDNITLTDFTGGAEDRFSIEGFAWPTTLSPGEQLLYEVTYTPESTDEIQGSIEIESDDPSATTTIVSVRVTSSSTPQIMVSSDSLLFPEAAPGSPQEE
ncbi:MAG: choice-of-anchor D domain-containing protein, partial [Myxococcota bacterium]